MTWASIGDLVEVVGGGTPRRTEPSYYDGGIPWVTPKDMKRPRIAESLVTLTAAGVANSPAKLVPPGSTLVVVRSGVLKHTLPVALTTAEVTLNQDMKALIPRTDVLDGSYLSRFVKAQESLLLRSVRATTADNFQIDDLLRIRFELPSLSEQRRIAAILDEADDLRSTANRYLQTLTAAAIAAFEATKAEAVAERPLGEIVTRISSGKSIVGGEDSPTAARVLKISAVTSGSFREDEAKSLPAGYVPPSDHLVRQGDLLVSRANTAALVGASAYVWSEPRAPRVLPDKLWRLHLDSRVDPLYLQSVLSAADFRREVSRRASGSGGAMKNIAQRDYLAIPIKVAPAERQRGFVDQVRQLRRLEESAATRLAHLNALFTSLQHRAFRGEL